jgi:hypothetical protein
VFGEDHHTVEVGFRGAPSLGLGDAGVEVESGTGAYAMEYTCLLCGSKHKEIITIIPPEGNHFIRNQAGAEWLCQITADDIAEIKMISGGGGPLPPVSFTHISSSTDKAVISNIFEEYYWLDSNGVKYTSSTNDSHIELSSVAIKNVYTDDMGAKHIFDTVVKNNIKGETVILDCANKVVSSSRANGRIFGNDFDFEWLPLYEGKNELSFVGNCDVTIEYRCPIKCGEY